MNAIKFIQDNGVDKAREVVEGAPEWAIFWITQGEYHISMLSFPNMVGHHSFLISDLKRLVESVELIGKYHSIDHAKNHYNNMREALNQYQYENKDIEDLSNKLKQAIAVYKSIYGGEHV